MISEGYSPPNIDNTNNQGEKDGAGQALPFTRSAERITWRSRLLPRHNDVIKKYFKEKPAK